MKIYPTSIIHITLSILFLLIPSTYGFSQEKSRVAILPFEAREVSQSESQVITELFETALVKTGVYNIIEQNQIEAIAEAQAYSLSGCVDDSCAVEVGKLLSAELIVIGTISKVGNKYIANSKIIDVALGKNIKADSVSADNLAEMTETKISFLAFKLAGLTYSENGNEQIASNFGEIYVGTDPPGAEVFVNGMRRGTSPMVVEKIPFGQVVVNVKKGNMVAEGSITINSSDLIELDLKLEVALGRLFIKSNDQNLIVSLDERDLGVLGSGIFRDIGTGEHILSLRGEGMYYEERITIDEGKKDNY